MSEFKENVKSIIFGTTTIYGKLFDIVLIGSIIISVIIVMLDSVSAYHATHGNLFYFWNGSLLSFSVLNTVYVYIVFDYHLVISLASLVLLTSLQLYQLI